MGRIRIFVVGLALVALAGLPGCALMSMLGGAESPRPKEYQVEAAKEIATQNVAEIMKGQTGKQTGIESVALEALHAIGKVNSKHQSAAITNVVANAVEAIREADGSAKLLGVLSGRTAKSISEMSAIEYLAYAAGQTTVATGNREFAARGIAAGWEWGKSQIAGVTGSALGGGGLIALALGMLRRGKKLKSKTALLKSTGKTIEIFASGNADAGKELKGLLAKDAAKLPVNAKEEFGV